MKPNVWNIKDVLNIPSTSMAAKSGKGGATSDYSSLTDSQLLFGSQFWPENSQGFSQELSGPFRGSQPASQEISELKVSTSYHSKPLLFGDGKAANITGGKTLGILDRFEEEKRKAKENEIVSHGFRQLHESLENIKRTILNVIEGSCDFNKKTVAEGIDSLRKTIQDDLANVKESIAGQAEVLANLQNQTHKERKDSEAKKIMKQQCKHHKLEYFTFYIHTLKEISLFSQTTLAVKDLSSLVLSLQQDLESLREDQRKEHSVFGELQSLLGTIMATQSCGALPRPVRMTDNTVQTSPGLVERFCVISEEKHFCEGIMFCSGTHSEGRADHSVCLVKAKSPKKLNTDASLRVLRPVSIDKQKQLFNNTAAEKSYCTRSVMTTASNPAVTTTVTADLQRSCIVGAPVHVERVKPLVNMEENRFTTWNEVSRQKKMPRRGQRSQHFRRKKRALILPQRRPNNRMASVDIFEDNQHNEEHENRVPLSTVKTVPENHLPSTKQQGTAGLTNRSGCGQHLNPWSWSQDSSSSQIMVEYKKAEHEAVMSEHKTNTIMRQTGIWQLFDFISDSD
ncbi:interactor of HORMAD1 protein 1 [Colossoma macropomum]|uniref:interactor of HORMAD1 protein 1 n=1 Tax=Colossoma macropomum TaxID=42526 RepID=UPI001863FE98|nr:interactor of HORMAD1 protein 1 [Colossoma macropomum]